MSRAAKDVKKYLSLPVQIWTALGITRAVFSFVRHGCDLLPGDDNCRLPAEDVGVEAQVVGGDIDTAMDQDVLLQGARVVAN